jgi:hypothetical protein
MSLDWPPSENPDQPQLTNRSARGDAFEDTALKPGFEIVKIQTMLYSLSSSLFGEIDITNGFLTLSLFG